jgi:hypothetical protein
VDDDESKEQNDSFDESDDFNKKMISLQNFLYGDCEEDQLYEAD